MNLDGFTLVLDLFVVLVMWPWVIRTGWQRYRSGRVPKRSLEHQQMIALVAFANVLRHRSDENRLTPDDVRTFGVLWMVIGCVGFAVGVFLLWLGVR